MSEEHKYHVRIEMIEDRVGKFLLDDKNKPVIKVATPPEFTGGKAGIHSPEDLFVGALASCIMTTLCGMAEKLKFKLKSLDVDAIGYLGKIEQRGYMFTKITAHLDIGIANEEDKKSAEKAIELTEKYCLISNSIKCTVNLTHTIKVVK